MRISEHDMTYIILCFYLRLCTNSHWTGTSIITLNLNLTSQSIYSTLVCGLWIFAGPPIYHLPSNIISMAVGLVYINLQPEYELPSLTHFGFLDSSRSLENLSWEHCL